MKHNYIKAVEMMGRPTFRDVMDEVVELYEDKSLEELSDVVHSACRFVGVPNNVIWYLARPTAMKHARRYEERGCPRSARNCFAHGEACCCRRRK